MDPLISLIPVLVVALVVLIVLSRSVRIVPQARAGIVERLGRYSRTLSAGLTILVPFIDRLRPLIDLREQVVSFPPQPVITQDNLVVSIDTVIYFQVTDAKAATYEIADYIQGVEQLTVTTLRNVVGGMDLEKTLTSRDEINSVLRGVLDEATGKWGLRVNRVELKAIDPPPSIQDSMEKQMRADRDKRAAILTAEGFKQSQILTAEGERQGAILRAEGEAQARILRAEGESKAITQVFHAIHEGNPDQKLLAYQYLQMLPLIAQGDANKVWIVPSELGKALEGLGSVMLITFPTLLAVGYPPVTANVSNNIGLVPGAVTGALGYRRELAGQHARLLRLGTASMAGSLTGASLLLVLPDAAFRAIVPVLVAAACVLVIVQPRVTAAMAHRRHPPPAHGGPYLVAAVVLAGVYGGYFGAAQGILLIALLGLFLDEDLQRLNGAKNVLTAVVNLVAGLAFIAVADVAWLPVLLIALGSIAGGVLGSTIGRRLPGAVLRGVIVVVSIVAIVALLR